MRRRSLSVSRRSPSSQELDLERNGSASGDGATERRTGLRQREGCTELEIEPSGGEILTGGRELLPVGADVERDAVEAPPALGGAGGVRAQTAPATTRREGRPGAAGRRIGSGIDTAARRFYDLCRPVRVVVVDHRRSSGAE